ncbi:MAG: M23 family metallopeptidase [Fibrobacteres bacterium]|nr:M23 family metallopeptidase [Fibrobacterota bacterium]
MIFAVMTISGDPLTDWAAFELNVRDGIISKDSARSDFPDIYKKIKSEAEQYRYSSDVKWSIPIAGCSITDFGKGGFKPDIRYGGSEIKGYDFYDGNRHGGHPAYDIFIKDKNRDCLDDKSGKSVQVVAPINCFVLTSSSGWMKGSSIRGGNYVWAFAPDSGYFLYFAHMREIKVKPGTFLKQGDTLGTVGRTGKNADIPRSPTHIHMTVLKVNGENLKPVDFINKF